MAELPVWDPKKVRREVLKDTIQHPITMFFSASAIISALYTTLISGSKQGLIIALASFGIATSSWIFNYFFRTDHFVELYYEKWKASVEALREKRIEGLRQELVKFSFQDGIQAFDDLQSAHQRFKDFLLDNENSGLSQMQRVHLESISGETYDLGMQIITRLVSLVRITTSVDINRFKGEIEKLEKQIQEMKNQNYEANDYKKHLSSLEIRKHAIEARVESYRKAELEIDSLLAKVEECENSIENSILQMPVFSGKVNDQQLQKALNEMETTVEAARRVSKRLENLDLNSSTLNTKEDDLYLLKGGQNE